MDCVLYAENKLRTVLGLAGKPIDDHSCRRAAGLADFWRPLLRRWPGESPQPKRRTAAGPTGDARLNGHRPTSGRRFRSTMSNAA